MKKTVILIVLMLLFIWPLLSQEAFPVSFKYQDFPVEAESKNEALIGQFYTISASKDGKYIAIGQKEKTGCVVVLKKDDNRWKVVKSFLPPGEGTEEIRHLKWMSFMKDGSLLVLGWSKVFLINLQNWEINEKRVKQISGLHNLNAQENHFWLQRLNFSRKEPRVEVIQYEGDLFRFLSGSSLGKVTKIFAIKGHIVNRKSGVDGRYVYFGAKPDKIAYLLRPSGSKPFSKKTIICTSYRNFSIDAIRTFDIKSFQDGFIATLSTNGLSSAENAEIKVAVFNDQGITVLKSPLQCKREKIRYQGKEFLGISNLDFTVLGDKFIQVIPATIEHEQSGFEWSVRETHILVSSYKN